MGGSTYTFSIRDLQSRDSVVFTSQCFTHTGQQIIIIPTCLWLNICGRQDILFFSFEDVLLLTAAQENLDKNN